MPDKKTSKIRRMRADETIEVGDIIVSKDLFNGIRNHHVRRVTKTLAMVAWNNVAEGVFRRDRIGRGGDVKLRGAGPWSQVRHTAYRRVES